MNDDKLIYLDLEFISRKYEEILGSDPKSVTTKHEGSSAGIKAFFANAGISTQESRSYSITSREMLHKVWGSLNERYQNYDGFENYNGTKIAWVEGHLTIAEWVDSERKKPGYEFYQLKNGEERTAFLTDISYFSAGFGKIFEASSALKGNIGIPVRCLTRIMWHVDDAKNYVSCPYVIIEKS